MRVLVLAALAPFLLPSSAAPQGPEVGPTRYTMLFTWHRRADWGREHEERFIRTFSSLGEVVNERYPALDVEAYRAAGPDGRRVEMTLHFGVLETLMAHALVFDGDAQVQEAFAAGEELFVGEEESHSLLRSVYTDPDPPTARLANRFTRTMRFRVGREAEAVEYARRLAELVLAREERLSISAWVEVFNDPTLLRIWVDGSEPFSWLRILDRYANDPEWLEIHARATGVFVDGAVFDSPMWRAY